MAFKYGSSFGFTVSRVRPYGLWKVYLPHQCEEWEITGHAETLDSAIVSLEQFIAEANEALEALRERREMGDGDFH